VTTDPFDAHRPLTIDGRAAGRFCSLPALEAKGLGRISRLPCSLRIVLESLLRHAHLGADGEAAVRVLAAWSPNGARTDEIPFVVARIIAPDASGIPLLADLAAMRDRARALGADVARIEPSVPVDLIVDHSLEVTRSATAGALQFNMRRDIERNAERYAFLKWAAQGFRAINVVPPGVGIIHQVNLEHLAQVVIERDGMFLPDTLVGTDSHTSMINGIGVVGWGVGGIEAEAAMLGQPIYFLTPDVVGVELAGELAPGITTTDVVLTVVERLRRAKVVGKFVEFIGDGAAALPASERATIANMAPEYGATVGYFAVDERTLDYLAAVGRSPAQLAAIRAYYTAQGLFGVPRRGDIDYSELLRIDLGEIEPSVAGPRRPQDRVALGKLQAQFRGLLGAPATAGGFDRGPAQANAAQGALRDGDIVIAAITSCSNTSNPSVMLGAGLLAQKAVTRGLRAARHVKTSLTPGSRVVAAYLRDAGLQSALDALGFQIAGYACATCMGNSGPLPPEIDAAIKRDDLVAVAVLSGNRNFEARIHASVKANYLMSPALVVAFAIAGRIDVDFDREPLGSDERGMPVYLRDIWPSAAEVAALLPIASDPANALALYSGANRPDSAWEALPQGGGAQFAWDPASSYLRRPPFVAEVDLAPTPFAPIRSARALAILGDSVTTDHVSPGGTIAPESPAGAYLRSCGVHTAEFNTYIARRANHEVMVRGTFANVRLRNLMVPGSEGGVTTRGAGEVTSIYDAAMAYARDGTSLVVIAGEEYGTGSSRDWAAKGAQLLGVRAVIARSFERIHRSNLVGMGILPCEFTDGDSAQSLGLAGDETFDILDIDAGIAPRQAARLRIARPDGSVREVKLRVRVDTPVEARYIRHGGILPYVFRQMMGASVAA
jgi:aconitate hydratase